MALSTLRKINTCYAQYYESSSNFCHFVYLIKIILIIIRNYYVKCTLGFRKKSSIYMTITRWCNCATFTPTRLNPNLTRKQQSIWISTNRKKLTKQESGSRIYHQLPAETISYFLYCLLGNVDVLAYLAG